jgi:hypothetical protein
VATCWLVGPEALPLKRKLLDGLTGDLNAVFSRFSKLDPRAALLACMKLVAEYVDTGASAMRVAQSSAGVCRAQRLGLAFRLRGGKVVSVRSAPLTARSVRYRCTASGGKMTITISGSNLRAQLGPRLRLGVYRSKHAPRRKARLTFKALGGGAVTPKPPPPPPPPASTFRLQPSQISSGEMTKPRGSVERRRRASSVTSRHRSSWASATYSAS